MVCKELVVEWNPTKEYPPFYQRFSALLRHLKYLLIQPQSHFVPNNPFNRKAAWNFHFNRANYRLLLQQYSPELLDCEVGKEMQVTGGEMEVEGDGSGESDFWGVDRIISKSRKGVSVMDTFSENTEEEEGFDFLAKKIMDIEFEREDVGA